MQEKENKMVTLIFRSIDELPTLFQLDNDLVHIQLDNRRHRLNYHPWKKVSVIILQ